MSDLKIIFESEGWIAVDKPAGWLTVPSRFESEDTRRVVGRELEKQTGKRIYPVHRLDVEVSGLVLFATSGETQRASNAWFEKRTVEKTYHGKSRPKDFAHWPADLPREDQKISLNEDLEWRCLLLRGKRRAFESPRGDSSVTKAMWTGTDRDGNLEWVLNPLTGRSHQLRFEMSRHGYPLLGDKTYGSQVVLPEGIALRAVRLELAAISATERRGLPESLEVKGLF